MKANYQNANLPYRRKVIGLVLAAIGGVCLVEPVMSEDSSPLDESTRLGEKDNQEKAAKRKRVFAAIRKKYDAPWKWVDRDDGVLTDVLGAISTDLIWIGQPVKELEAAFGRDSLHWLDREGEGLVLIGLGRQRRHLDQAERKHLDRMAPNPLPEWHLFVYIDKRKGEITDLLLRYGSFNGFNMRGFLTTKRPIVDNDNSKSGAQEPTDRKGPNGTNPSQ